MKTDKKKGKRIPINALKEFLNRFNLTHVIIYTYDQKSKMGNVATYGKTLTQCGQAADFGNQMKKYLGWPESLEKQPSRVRKLQKQIKEQKELIEKMKCCENCKYFICQFDDPNLPCEKCKNWNEWRIVE